MQHYVWMTVDQINTLLQIYIEVDPESGCAHVWKVWNCLKHKQIELDGAERLVLADKLSFRYTDVRF